MVVQAIELGFYIWLISHFSVLMMAATRHRDWIFSTPLMLFSAVLYFKYEDYRERSVDTIAVWQDFVRDDKSAIAMVLGGKAVLGVVAWSSGIGGGEAKTGGSEASK
jgi:hypothetical protein